MPAEPYCKFIIIGFWPSSTTTNKQANKQANKQTNEQTNAQSIKHTHGRDKPPMKSGQRYFPPLVNWSVVENNVSAFHARCLNTASSTKGPLRKSWAIQHSTPSARIMFKQNERALRRAAPNRRCSPPFRGGLRPPHCEKKAGEKHLGAPARPL